MPPSPNYNRPDLVAAYQAGDRRAGDELLRLNERWIRKCVWPYRRPHIDEDDLFQEGRAAFVRCLAFFDPEASSLTNWSRICIQKHVRRWSAEYGVTVRVPHAAIRNMREATKRGAEPCETGAAAASAIRRPVYLDEPVGDDGESTRGAMMAGEDETVEDTLVRLTATEAMRRAVKGLPRAHRELIEARLDGQTQYDVADAKGVSHQAVSQMERKAVERLREAMGVE